MTHPARLVLLSFLSIVFLSNSYAQTKPAPVPAQEKPARTNIDETFELNIAERRFTEENFAASTSVATEGDAGLNLQIGVGLTASRIDVLMRNIRGNVRFHGTLDRILEMLRSRPRPSGATGP